MSFSSDPICAVVAAPSASAMLRDLRQAAHESGTCELRLDWLANSREIQRTLAALPGAIAKIRAVRNRGHAPGDFTIIATLRRRAAGGRFRGTLREQFEFLLAAASAGCAWCDIEVESAEKFSAQQFAHLRREGARILISFHDFRRTPRNLSSVVARLDRCCGDAIKIATECKTISDAARVLACARGRRNVIAIPMGEIGLPGRILGLRAGSALAYASVTQSTAPGQLSVSDMRERYRADKLDRRTRIFAIVGDPVAHSLSPAIHNAGYIAQRKNAVFVPMRAQNIREVVAAVRDFDLTGFAVTIPHKETILRHLAKCDPLATRIGAVNTVAVAKNGRLHGYNTDYAGVLRAIDPHLRIRGSRVLIFGAGGAARAAAFALTDAGATLTICSRRTQRARALARECGATNITRAELKRSTFDLIINATPVGMSAKDPSPLRKNELNCRYIMDMIYNPTETPLLKLARARNIKTISGLEMFIAQAAAQWKIWIHSPAPVTVMRDTALKSLREKCRRDAAQPSKRSHRSSRF